jgi:two-component system response regulator AtoC
VLLDEVGELTLAAQAKLLRALEVKRITRLGDTREREIDVRIVAATNRDLEAESRAGTFRKDLLFRLSAAVIELPPLCQRPREVPILARLFLGEASARAERTPLELSEAALYKLASYSWPGNVRELKNAMDFAVATAEGTVIEPWNLPERVAGRASPAAPREAAASAVALPLEGAASGPAEPAPRHFRPIAEELRAIERARMVEALEATGGVQTRAAELISMPIRTFALKIKQYGVSPREARRP